MTAAEDAQVLNRRVNAPVRPADTIALTELILPSAYADRHCPECGLIEPHHHSGCIWKEM